MTHYLIFQANCNVNSVNNNGRCALHQAAEKGCIDIVELLIPGGAYVDMQTSEGDTALMMAARKGHFKVTQLLLEVKCNVNIKNSKRVTALHEAATYGFTDIVRILLQHGAFTDVLDLEQDSPMTLAAWKGHTSVVELLIKSGCELNLKNDMGRTALIEAAENQNVDIILLLLKSGAEINVQDYEGDTAVIVAAAKGHFKVVQTLVNAGCDLKIVNKYGRTALHEACSVWTPPYRQSVEILLDGGLCPDIQDYMGNTPLVLATLSGREIVVWLLLRANCDFNLVGWSMGKSLKPLQVAVTYDKLNIVKMLTLVGANMNSVNIWINTGSGPQYMVPVSNTELKEWLMEHTSNPPSLKCCCRKVIRQRLGRHINTKISQIPLPKTLNAYLELDDLKEFIPEDNAVVSPSVHNGRLLAQFHNVGIASDDDSSTMDSGDSSDSTV